jgi:hypothetical protein
LGERAQILLDASALPIVQLFDWREDHTEGAVFEGLERYRSVVETDATASEEDRIGFEAKRLGLGREPEEQREKQEEVFHARKVQRRAATRQVTLFFVRRGGATFPAWSSRG